MAYELTIRVQGQLSGIDYWRLCEAFNVIEAALLIVGGDPGEDGLADEIEDWAVSDQPAAYIAARNALMTAIKLSILPAHIIYHGDPMDDFGGRYNPLVDSIDWKKTIVTLFELKAWLLKRGITSGFFFPQERERASYLDPSHPRYAPKLAAAIRAWEAAESHDTGRSPKTALAKWLRENAPKYSLTDNEGKVNETGIEECAKVANWEPKGGAPRTPDSLSATPPMPVPITKSSAAKGGFCKPVPTIAPKKNNPIPSFAEDDIPF